MNEGIKMEKWKEYFAKLPGGGVEGRVVTRERRVRGEEKEEELKWRELQNAMKKLKDEKAAGMDGVPGEV